MRPVTHMDPLRASSEALLPGQNSDYKRVITSVSGGMVTDDLRLLGFVLTIPSCSPADLHELLGGVLTRRAIRRSLERLVLAGMVEWADNTDASTIHPLVAFVSHGALSAAGAPRPAAGSTGVTPLPATPTMDLLEDQRHGPTSAGER